MPRRHAQVHHVVGEDPQEEEQADETIKIPPPSFFYGWTATYMSGPNLVTAPVCMSRGRKSDCSLLATFSSMKSTDTLDAMLVPILVLMPFDLPKVYARQTGRIDDADMLTLIADHVYKTMPRHAAYTRNNSPDDLVRFLKAHSYCIDLNSALRKAADNLTVTEQIHAGLSKHEKTMGMPPALATFYFRRDGKRMILVSMTLDSVFVASVTEVQKLAFTSLATATPIMVTRALTDEEYLDSITPFVEPGQSPPPPPAPQAVPVEVAVKRYKRRVAFKEDTDSAVTNVTDVTLDRSDVEEVQSTFFFADNVVHKLLFQAINSHQAEDLADVFVFNTMLMAQLTKTSTPTCRTPEERVRKIFEERVFNYATGLDTISNTPMSYLVDKKFILFPVHAHTHWAMYMFYDPFNRSCKDPIAFIFDSKYNIARRIGVIPSNEHAQMLVYAKLYLMHVITKYAPERGTLDLISCKRATHFLDVPQQPYRINACGYYMCEFVRHILKKGINGRMEFVSQLTAHPGEPVFVEEFEAINAATLPQIREDIVALLTGDALRKKLKQSDE